jgi:hypothetical protein
MTISELKKGYADVPLYHLAYGITVREVRCISIEEDKERAIVEYSKDGYDSHIKAPIAIKDLYPSVESVIKAFANKSLRLLDKQYEITVKEI